MGSSNNNLRPLGRLRNKILLSMIGLILLFAFITGIATRMILLRALKAEFQSAIQKTITLVDLVIVIVTLVIIIISILLAERISRLITDREELTKFREREKIALDLHDNCAQDLANLIKRLELCERLFKVEPLKALEELKALQENIRGHLFKARQIIHGLKSPEENLLLAKIDGYSKDYQRHNEIKIKLNVCESIDNIPADKATHIFYIISEVLTNIRKHAQAKNIELSLNDNGINELTLKIKDDGIGFNLKETRLPASGSGKWGLMGMRQRVASLGGTLVINSAPKQGTEVLVRIPFSGII